MVNFGVQIKRKNRSNGNQKDAEKSEETRKQIFQYLETIIHKDTEFKVNEKLAFSLTIPSSQWVLELNKFNSTWKFSWRPSGRS